MQRLHAWLGKHQDITQLALHYTQAARMGLAADGRGLCGENPLIPKTLSHNPEIPSTLCSSCRWSTC